jgi:probable rRNA maturation factor
MIDVELDHLGEWGEDQDWQSIAERAVGEAFAVASVPTDHAISISVSLSDNATVHTLNREWRSKDQPTNVLSFPMLEADELDGLQYPPMGNAGMEILLGDIILANGVCVAEAEEKGIPLPHHVTHLIIHGTLHLLGYDHIDEIEAEHMEVLEVKALASLGLANPYSEN